jgi:hypothetical protein
MAYTIPEIITWSRICQPLARIGEAKRLVKGDKDADPDLDIKLYMTRKDVEYAYAQNADSDILHIMGNYLLMLCGRYLFQAQQTNVGGGTITPITPGTMPDPYDFEVSASSFIATGATTKTFPTSWQGLNMLFVRNNITQSTVNQGSSYYSWDKTTRLFTLINGAAQSTELFQIYPMV